MKKYSITKYVRSDYAPKKEWTSICDIGKKYNGVRFCLDDYRKVEDSYVDAILEIAKYMKIESFKMKDICRWKDLKSEVQKNTRYKNLYTDEILSVYENVTSNMIIRAEDLKHLIRLELREDIGGLLYVPHRLKIFIGYDYMMGVHSSMSLENIFKDIKNLGLNIYQFY